MSSVKSYTLLNFSTKESGNVEASSYEEALAEFCHCDPPRRPYHTTRGLRLYSVDGQTIGVSVEHSVKKR